MTFSKFSITLFVFTVLAFRSSLSQSSSTNLETVQCDPSQAEIEACTAIYDPVCIPAPKQCFTTPCFQTEDVSNPCEACANPDVNSYTPGRCRYTCDPENLPPSGAPAESDFVVCAYYEEDCGDSSCRNTFERASIACQDSAVLYFILDACPGKDLEAYSEEEQQEECYFEEERKSSSEQYVPNSYDAIISCPSRRGDFCNDLYNPVCPVECVNGDCGGTAGNSCTACSDTNVLSYTPGPCEVERITCETQASGDVCDSEYAPVCAYKSDCTREPCGKTASNICEACNGGADYAIDGECGSWGQPNQL